MRLDCPPRCRALLGDPAIPLWITEGQKKADALASAGATALALLGVWNLKGKNAFGGITVLAVLTMWPGKMVLAKAVTSWWCMTRICIPSLRYARPSNASPNT
jgi:hypothetical protein